MINNERGGFISNIFLIPAALALMLGCFLLGYYVGKYQTRPNSVEEVLKPLPEVVAKAIPKQEEFTFYKTLTDKSDKTVSIELKPKTDKEPEAAQKAKTAPDSVKSDLSQTAKKDGAPKSVKEHTEPAKPVQTAKQTSPAAKESGGKLRYTVQVASYPEKNLAEDEVKSLKKRGYAAFIASSEVSGKGTWHRVRLGSFSNKAAAEKLQRDLRSKEGISAIIAVE